MNKKQIRSLFRKLVFERDNYMCRNYGCKNKAVDAHHITDRNQIPNGGYVLSNGISLCSTCHLEAEKWHQYDGMQGSPPKYYYDIINSSAEKAWEDSKELK